MELPDVDVETVLKGALPPIAAAVLVVGTLGARWTAFAVGVGTFVAYCLLKEMPAWPHELWARPDGRAWLVWGIAATAFVALLEHGRVLRGKVGAVAGALVAAFAVFVLQQKLAQRWDWSQLAMYVGGGGVAAMLVTSATRVTLARAPASIAPAVVFSLLLSALSVLLTLARSGLIGQLGGAVAAAAGAAAGTAVWKRPFALAAGDGTWLGAAWTLLVLAGAQLAYLPWAAAGCAAVAPCALLLLRASLATRPLLWSCAALLLAGVPLGGAFWFTLQNA